MTKADAFDQAGAELQPLFPDGIPTGVLKRRARELSGHKLNSLLPTDHCHNWTNGGITLPSNTDEFP